MAELRSLKQKRAQIKGQVTRITNYFEQADAPSRAEAQVRLTRLNELWDRFEETQSEIEIKVGAEEHQKEAAEREVFEMIYFDAAARAQEIVEADSKQQAQQHVMQAQMQAQMQANLQEEPPRGRIVQPEDRQHEIRRSKPKLPEIKLPEFKGEYTKWTFFKNSFETTIHNDIYLTAMQKHQYLVGVLQGEALQVIQGFSISEENYESAWQLLKDTYDNQMVIIETHLDEMLSFPVITKENKADAIRKFIWHIHTHTKSLEALRQPVAQWDTIILHLAKKKLDFAEQRDWQDFVKNRTPQDMPKLSEFLKFLTERCHSLRMLKQNKERTVNEKQTAINKKKVNLAAITEACKTETCKICAKNHPIYKCEEFLKMSIPERMAKVREKKFCLNCLKTGHYAQNCKASTMCKGKQCKRC